MSFNLSQDVDTSLSNFCFSLDRKTNETYFSILKTNFHEVDSAWNYHENDFAEGVDQFVEEKIVVPKPLTIDIQDQQTLFSYNGMKDIMVSNFCQRFSLLEGYQ